MQDLKAEISRKVSIDEKKVSLNALELLTRERGIEKSISNILQDCI
jgi:hypothetical protein